MDGTTEPVVAVIGHPIAGNPAQFAIERALLSLQLPWRVMSFDIAPANVEPALNGLETLAFRGVLVDRSLAPLAAAWYRAKDTSRRVPSLLGCLYRDAGDPDIFAADTPATRWLAKELEPLVQEGKVKSSIWLGDDDPVFPQDLLNFSTVSARKKIHHPESLAAFDLVVLATSDHQPLDLRIQDWLPGDGATLVLDLSAGHPHQVKIRELGYRLISAEQIHAGMICEAIRSWTSQVPAEEVVQEAIEEYLAV